MRSMNVKQMIEWLQTQPQDAIVEVVCTDTGNGYHQDTSVSTRKFDPTEHVELYDWTGNKYVEPGDPHYNKKVLTLGKND